MITEQLKRSLATDRSVLSFLARESFREFSDTGIPRWVADLSEEEADPHGHAQDRARWEGLVAWENGWRLTEAGWRMLRIASPERLS